MYFDLWILRNPYSASTPPRHCHTALPTVPSLGGSPGAEKSNWSVHGQLLPGLGGGPIRDKKFDAFAADFSTSTASRFPSSDSPRLVAAQPNQPSSSPTLRATKLPVKSPCPHLPGFRASISIGLSDLPPQRTIDFGCVYPQTLVQAQDALRPGSPVPLWSSWFPAPRFQPGGDVPLLTLVSSSSRTTGPDIHHD